MVIRNNEHYADPTAGKVIEDLEKQDPDPKKAEDTERMDRSLSITNWHWMRDEFGQRVRKCNNERRCYASRKPEADAAFRRAMRK